MQSTKALAAIGVAMVLGMMTAAFLPGCQPTAPVALPTPTAVTTTAAAPAPRLTVPPAVGGGLGGQERVLLDQVHRMAVEDAAR